MLRVTQNIFVATMCGLLGFSPVAAQSQQEREQDDDYTIREMPDDDFEARDRRDDRQEGFTRTKLKTKPDSAQISISGRVTSAEKDSFMLDYGDGLITVEMDDWEWYTKGQIAPGERVTIYGQIDESFYEDRTIKADGIYAADRNILYYAAESGENRAQDFTNYYPTVERDGMMLRVTGPVTNVDDREFTLDTGQTEIQIDTTTMSYNPMDEVGFQKIRAGDVVSVYGLLDSDVFLKREIKAETITTLSPDAKRRRE